MTATKFSEPKAAFAIKHGGSIPRRKRLLHSRRERIVIAKDAPR